MLWDSRDHHALSRSRDKIEPVRIKGELIEGKEKSTRSWWTVAPAEAEEVLPFCFVMEHETIIFALFCCDSLQVSSSLFGDFEIAIVARRDKQLKQKKPNARSAVREVRIVTGFIYRIQLVAALVCANACCQKVIASAPRVSD